MFSQLSVRLPWLDMPAGLYSSRLGDSSSCFPEPGERASSRKPSAVTSSSRCLLKNVNAINITHTSRLGPCDEDLAAANCFHLCDGPGRVHWFIYAHMAGGLGGQRTSMESLRMQENSLYML